MEQQLDYEDDSFLQANMMGDIREDIEFLGLTLADVCWIIGLTILLGGFSFALPISVWLKLSWVVVIFVLSAVGRWCKWSFRLRRQYHHARSPKQVEGETMGEWLGMAYDGWFYRSEEMIHVVLSVTALPWSTATLSAKKQRLAGFENFLRACSRESLEASFSSEMVNDFRHELWHDKEVTAAASSGIAKLKEQRLAMWRNLAVTGEAQRSEYTLRLSIPAYEITIRERDDESVEADKVELERFRMVAELREKIHRTMSGLEGCGHTWSISSGFALPELLGRWWSRAAWEEWKSMEGEWEEALIEKEAIHEKDAVVSVEAAVEALLMSSDESLTSIVAQASSIQEQNDQNMVNDSWLEELNLAANESDEEPTGTVEIAELMDDHNEEVDAVASEPASKVNDKKKSVTDVLRKMKKSIYAQVQHSKVACKSTRAWFSKLLWLNWRKKSEQKQIESMLSIVNSEDGQAQEEVIDPTISEQISSTATFSGIYFMVSPVPTGKSFLTTNMAVAHSRPDQTIHVVDLTRDKGCLSLLNPLSTASKIQGWECWHSPHAPHLFLWTPAMYIDLSLLQAQLLAWSQEGIVFVELPYHYPKRDQLLEIGQTVGIFDTDYHHWLQWEKEEMRLDQIWLNQADQKMRDNFSPLLQEKFGQAPALCMPYYSEAAWWCFQGRPLAVQHRVKAQFQMSQTVGSPDSREVMV